jgi:hypothetical protein
MRPIFHDFCIFWFGIGLLHYISSHSDFGFKFAEIFVIEKGLPQNGELVSRRLSGLANRGVVDSLTQCVGESLTL